MTSSPDSTTTLQLIIGIATVVVLILSIPTISKWIDAWRERRRLRKDERYAGEVKEREKLGHRVKVLEEAVEEIKKSVTEILSFIKGTPDPFRKNEDGSPVVEGGLVKTLSDILSVIKKSEARDDDRGRGH